MKLHRKLLLYLVSLVLSVLLVFGFINYQITHTANIESEQYILQISLQYHADILANVYQNRPELSTLSNHFQDKASHPFFLSILDQNNAYLVKQTPPKGQYIPPRNQLNQARSGRIDINDQLYLWQRTPIQGSPYQLLQIYHSQYASSLLNTLTVRMLITGLVILWLAGWLGIIISSTIAKKLQAQTNAIQYQSTHDNLTGLPNRLLLYELLEKGIIKAKDKSSQLTLIVMDLNRFKEVNDTLGHDIGDLLLCQISERLQQLLSDSDIVARMGGDEFAILIRHGNETHIQDTIDNITTALQKPFTIKELLLEAETSLGIACYPEHGEDAHTLIRHADTAMYLAKHSGELFAFYDRNKDPHSLKRLTLMGDLRRAIEDGNLELNYQPKADIRQRQINSVEALLRWPHPIYGYIQPDIFIELAEQTGIIKPLTYWTLKTGIEQCARWHTQGMILSVAINLSPRMLHNLNITSEIKAMLEHYGLAAKYLELEITETAIMQEPERAQEILGQLHDMGVKLSIDDFGTGYTSLAYLKNLPVDEIKIDMSFIQGMLNDKADAMIVRSIIELAHNMNFMVVAEGVSSAALFDHLAAEGCEIAQGAYISYAMNAKDFNRWYQDSDWGISTDSRLSSSAAVVLKLDRENSNDIH